ncbi:MAG: hypothetical protein AAB263_04410 [Planctomycetota bacterium]
MASLSPKLSSSQFVVRESWLSNIGLNQIGAVSLHFARIIPRQVDELQDSEWHCCLDEVARWAKQCAEKRNCGQKGITERTSTLFQQPKPLMKD